MLRTIALLSLIPTLAGAQLTRPATWQYRTDRPVPDSTIFYVGMPPGWHMTTGPGTIFYDPAFKASGRYAIDAEIFLFPGESHEGYGVFIGGAELEGTSPSWIAFLLTRDGSATIERHRNGRKSVLFPVTKAESVKPHPGGSETAHNVLRVAVERDSIIFSANGGRITAVPHSGLGITGTFGFRIGEGINIHASNLDLVTRFAPVPVRR